MPYRTRRWLWAGRVAAALVLAGLTAYMWAVGTVQAGVLAAPVGLIVAVAALFAPFLLPTYETLAEPDTTAEEAKPIAREPASRVSWPVLVGQVPPLASAFQDRAGLRERVLAARRAGRAVVLTQVLSGEGGVGKSQFTASLAREAVATGTDLVVWANASDVGSMIEALALATRRVQAPGATGTDAEADARALLDWAATTHRSWLVVFDDISEPDQVADWWPASDTGTGWVLATTRRRDAILTGSGKTLINVGVYSRAESLAYLADRLASAGRPDLIDDRADALAGELGDLPLALSHAAAFMLDEQITCGAYLDRLTATGRLNTLMPATADADHYGRTVAVTLLQALGAANACEPAGLASPAICLAGLLDPAGHPAALWETDAVTRYLARYRAEPDHAGHAGHAVQSLARAVQRQPVHPADGREVLLLLHRYGLASFDGQAGPRAVRVHALTGRAAREITPPRQVRAAALAAADALAAIWPDPDQTQPTLASALRANAAALHRQAGRELWKPDGHPVIFLAGNSLLSARLHTPAITYWEHIARESDQVLGAEHPDTLGARLNLAHSYWLAGRTADAIQIEEIVATGRERVLGPDHPDTLRAQGNLAMSYAQAGRTTDAIQIEEIVATGRARVLGPDHPDTLRAQGNLAERYRQMGNATDAISLGERVAADMERVLGPDHPDSLTARGNLAVSYAQAGRTDDAITILEQVTTDRARILGPHHPDTLRARANLAVSYKQAGRGSDAIRILEQVAADRARILGPDHPDTHRARANLAVSYEQAGRATDAITILEQVATDRARILGPDHPDTMSANQALEQWKRRPRP